MLRFVKDWTLPVAMFLGILGHSLFSQLTFLTPYLIFAMLLLTFSNIPPAEMRIRPLHLWLLSIQILGSLLIYLLMFRFDKIVAEGALICIMAPTATSAAVITHKLGGSAASVTVYTLLGNLGLALAAPLVFPLIETRAGMSFINSSLLVMGKVFPLLIFPFLLALLLRRFTPEVSRKLRSWQEGAFYLWAFALMIVTAQILESFMDNPRGFRTKFLTCAVSLAVCLLQFFVGRKIGGRYGDKVSGGQALGQKNTVLAIWLTVTYLDPLAAIGPGFYVLWQNVVNSWQLWRKRSLPPI